MEARAGEETVFKCHLCGKSYKWEMCLMAHMTYHTVESKSKCDACHKSFHDEGQRNRHMVTHDVFECNVCDKVFTCSSDLQTHMGTHTSDAGFQCPVCDGSFTDAEILKTHMETHMGKQTYQCRLFKKSFRCQLKMHRAMQRNLIPDMSIKPTNDLNRQMEALPAGKSRHGSENDELFSLQSNTREKHFRCPVCDKLFQWIAIHRFRVSKSSCQ